jgi:hypothetical protein
MQFSILRIYLHPNHTQFYMKKIILALLAVCSVAAADAQSHTWLLYGNVGFNSTKDSAAKTATSFNVTPGFGYQFNDNWTVGVAIGYAQTSTKFNGASGTTTDHGYQAGAFIRYARPIAGIFSWYTQLDAYYMGGNTTPADGGSAINKQSGFTVAITPTISAAIGHGYALNLSLGNLSFMTNKYDGASNSSSNFNFNFGTESARIGLSKNFGCGHKMKGHHEPGDDTHHIDASDDNDDAPKTHHKHHKEKKDKDNDD